jgi:L-ascorbate metabolism protein UlaG (beta-lactamase superfamily)
MMNDNNYFRVIWLGQSGFLFESRGEKLLIDPFYSDIVEQKEGFKRLMQAPIPIEGLDPSVIFITHNHLDHFDPIALPEIHAFYPTIPIIGPESVMKKANEMGFTPSVLKHIEKGKTIEIGNFKITATAAYHSDPFSVGCLIEVGDKTIYYSGDTLLTDTLLDDIISIKKRPIDIVFIVINGRLGNMNVQEAIKLTSQLNPKLAIPMHYGMFAENTEDPSIFTNGCAEKSIKSIELKLGKETEL